MPVQYYKLGNVEGYATSSRVEATNKKIEEKTDQKYKIEFEKLRKYLKETVAAQKQAEELIAQFRQLNDIKKIKWQQEEVNALRKTQENILIQEQSLEKEKAEYRKNLQKKTLKVLINSENEYYAQRTVAEREEREKEYILILKIKEAELLSEKLVRVAAARGAAAKLKQEEKYNELIEINRKKILKSEEAARKKEEAYLKIKLKNAAKNLDYELMAVLAAKQATEAKEKLNSLTDEKVRMQAAGEDTTEIDAKIKEQSGIVRSAEAARISTKLLADSIAKISSAIDNSINQAGRYQSSINARLQGTEKTYSSITRLMRNNLAMSSTVSQQAMLENIKKLSDEGIAYNIEQRAFLMTISDKIATTFDAANGTLLRLIRLQQADTTGARLGMEASLTKFFNNLFSDTSYLTNLYDTVSGALIEANSLMTRELSLEFEYITQKWLGSLAALGMSDSSITNIATALNYLGTGNVQALSGNESLLSLLALSANRAGLPYSDLLTKGLNASDTNELLKSMVMYLKEIANNDNQIVKAAYSDIFGLSVSDLRAISSLTPEDITTIGKSTLSYDQATKELSSQISSAGKRMSTAELIENIYQNVLYSIGDNIATNPFLNATWKINSLVEQATGGINIPFVSVVGNGLDLNASVNLIVKLGLVGLGTLEYIPQIISSIANNALPTDKAWKASDFTARGKGFTTSYGISSGISSSSYIGSGDTSDMYKSSLAGASKEAGETAPIVNAGTPPAYTSDNIYREMFVDKNNTIDVNLRDISHSVLTKLAEYLKVSMSSSDGTESSGEEGATDITGVINLLQEIIDYGVKAQVVNDFADQAYRKLATSN